jgi:hypothetical protein
MRQTERYDWAILVDEHSFKLRAFLVVNFHYLTYSLNSERETQELRVVPSPQFLARARAFNLGWHEPWNRASEAHLDRRFPRLSSTDHLRQTASRIPNVYQKHCLPQGDQLRARLE